MSASKLQPAKVVDLLPELALRRWKAQHPQGDRAPHHETYGVYCRHFQRQRVTLGNRAGAVCLQCANILWLEPHAVAQGRLALLPNPTWP